MRRVNGDSRGSAIHGLARGTVFKWVRGKVWWVKISAAEYQRLGTDGKGTGAIRLLSGIAYNYSGINIMVGTKAEALKDVKARAKVVADRKKHVGTCFHICVGGDVYRKKGSKFVKTTLPMSTPLHRLRGSCSSRPGSGADWSNFPATPAKRLAAKGIKTVGDLLFVPLEVFNAAFKGNYNLSWITARANLVIGGEIGSLSIHVSLSPLMTRLSKLGVDLTHEELMDLRNKVAKDLKIDKLWPGFEAAFKDILTDRVKIEEAKVKKSQAGLAAVKEAVAGLTSKLEAK